MAKAAQDDDSGDAPLDPAVERVRRRLVRFIAINLGILFAALLAVFVALVYRSLPDGEARPPVAELPGEAMAGRIDLPAGARIVSQSLSGERIAIDAELAGGGRAIFIFDIRAGRIVGRFDVGAP